MDPEFWEELTRSQHDEQLPDVAETLQEDLEFDTELEDKDADDSDVSMQTLITALTREDIPETVGFRKGGTLTSLTNTENVDLDEGMLPLAEANVENIPRPSGEVGHGTRQNLPASVTMERNSGSTTMMMTGRMTAYFQLVEIDGNQCVNINGWSACLAEPVLAAPPSKHQLDKHVV